MPEPHGHDPGVRVRGPREIFKGQAICRPLNYAERRSDLGRPCSGQNFLHLWDGDARDDTHEQHDSDRLYDRRAASHLPADAWSVRAWRPAQLNPSGLSMVAPAPTNVSRGSTDEYESVTRPVRPSMR